MKNKNIVERILFITFTCVGIGFMIAGMIWYCVVKQKHDAWILTKAEIINIERENHYGSEQKYTVLVKFSVKEKTYQAYLPYYNSNMKIEDIVTIYYNPNNPTEIIGNNSLGYIIFICVGAIFTIIGFIPFIFILIKKRKSQYLIKNGKKIEATIDNVSFKMNYAVNGRNPFILECSYVDQKTGKVYFFQSDSIWYPIEIILERHNIKTVPVYVDDSNFKKYYVDITVFEKYLGN